MKIGFFGDSYVDIVEGKKAWIEPTESYSEHPERRIWAQILLDNLNATCVASGLGGSNQYFAVKSWQNYINEYNVPPDVAIFTFTWHFRLMHNLHQGAMFSSGVQIDGNVDYSEILRNKTQGKKCDTIVNETKIDEIEVGFHLYYKHFYNDEQNLFLQELFIKYILELPNYYPTTKFIFLPNTEISLDIAKKYLQKGVLMNFALGTISEIEGENVNAFPMIPSEEPKWGHLFYDNHLKLSSIVQEVLENYQKFDGSIYTKDYSYFERKK